MRSGAKPSPLVTSVLLSGLLLAACASPPTGLTGGKGQPSGESSGGDSSGNGSSSSSGGGAPDPETDPVLAARTVDYGEALRTASLKLLGALPKLSQIKALSAADDKKAFYEAAVDAMFEDPRYAERMIKWWKDTMRMGDDGGRADGMPSRDAAPVFAAKIMIEERPYSDLFTATSGTCPSYDEEGRKFVDGDCDNGVGTHAGVLTNPGVMFQYFGNMAFRRVRWVQEIFVCTKFPAEFSEEPVKKGAGDYTSPWPFGSIATSPINFQDTSSVVCANCHTSINHLAPLFANFDDRGQLQGSIQVQTPTAPNPTPTALGHWLAPGEKTHWRMDRPVDDLSELGDAMAEDDDVAQCAVARAWNFVMSKQDVVTDLAMVPPEVVDDFRRDFDGHGMNLKRTMRAMFKSDDFVKF